MEIVRHIHLLAGNFFNFKVWSTAIWEILLLYEKCIDFMKAENVMSKGGYFTTTHFVFTHGGF
jgi:hypothetical protein